MLEISEYTSDGVRFRNNFPLKQFVYEPLRMFYARYYEFEQPQPNYIVSIEADERYERIEKDKIEKEIGRQQIINQWVQKAKNILEERGQLAVDELMNMVLDTEKDLSVAYQVASRMIAYVSENNKASIDIEQKIISLPQQNLSLWKTKIMK